eukprot:14013816-Alexandrium_andersonii.AAC.1
MSASLVGSEMCIRDSPRTSRGALSASLFAPSAKIATRASPELSRSTVCTPRRAANGFDNGAAGSG